METREKVFLFEMHPTIEKKAEEYYSTVPKIEMNVDMPLLEKEIEKNQSKSTKRKSKKVHS